MGSMKGKTEEAERDHNPTGGKKTVSTIPEPLDVTWSNNQRANIGWSITPSTYVAEQCLVFPQWERMHLIL